MKKILWIVAAGMFAFSASSVAQTTATQSDLGYKLYGQSFEKTPQYSPIRLPVLLHEEEQLKNVELIGYVSEVCQKEGCWLKLKSGKNSMDEVMVKMKDHAFLLPKDVAGKKAVIHGTVSKKMVSIEQQQHYLKDAGASQEEIDKITAPKESYVMIADGVKIAN